MSWEQRFLLVLGLVLIAGCAGQEALRWYPEKKQPCGLVVCEHRGPGRMDYEKDCFCSGKTPEEVFRDLGI